jgi:hypothetical protein
MRTKLCDKFQKEREDICDKIINIIGVNESGSFLLCDLENDINKQQSILDLKEDIQKFFAVSSMNSFKPNIQSTRRDYLNIIRGILKQQHYTFISNGCYIKNEDGSKKKTTKYFIIKNIKE